MPRKRYRAWLATTLPSGLARSIILIGSQPAVSIEKALALGPEPDLVLLEDDRD